MSTNPKANSIERPELSTEDFVAYLACPHARKGHADTRRDR